MLFGIYLNCPKRPEKFTQANWSSADPNGATVISPKKPALLRIS